MENESTENVSETVSESVREAKKVLHLDDLKEFITWQNLAKLTTTIIAILIFYIVYRIIKNVVLKKAKDKMQPHNAMLLNKVVSYVFYILISMYILGLFGINLSAIWGAAGVAGLAIGFAAQTSASNLISGLFVLSEKTIKMGDYISIGDESGIVDSIGLLSIKIHTLDNQLVRIPNSTVINSNLKNYNSYTKRRLVFDIPISYEADLDKALNAIKKVPAACPAVLPVPEPNIFYDGFGDAISLKLAVWFENGQLAEVKNQVYTNIVKICRADNVEIPYTRYDVKIINNK
ncbi:small-conductance mechanosensitive channel [Treponema rectale]|uniref:Small-conductance mechanosensitive channel n=1 Tax=Treponema rectale TaxID=744512 RepID=A0A840SGP1_9SPIR|nr:mechanosensitive ion channel family protein [Treponema rectale]MBB5218601.1 small-conductance mechanosensitive channel [Treponema rectale]